MVKKVFSEIVSYVQRLSVEVIASQGAYLPSRHSLLTSL